VAAEPIYGLTTDNRIFVFESGAPGAISPLRPVTGLPDGTTLVGLDFRPATPGVLVGVGQIGSAGAVFTIDRFSGAATQINSIPTLSGTAFGVDFNPVPGALRIVSNADQNLRITAGGAGVVNSDATLNPGNPNVVGAAYSNNVPGGAAGQTTLYDIDSVLDRLFTQGTVNFPPGTSPNTGTLFDVGDLGVDTTDLVGFDISGRSGVAFASLMPEGAEGSSLYVINLATGAATLVGAIDGGSLLVRAARQSRPPGRGRARHGGDGAAQSSRETRSTCRRGYARQHAADGLGGEAIGTLVQGHAGMPRHLVPGDVALLHLDEEGLPEVAVLHRLLLGVFPAVLPPAHVPLLAEAVDHVGTVGEDVGGPPRRDRAEALQHAGQLHALIGGGRLGAGDLALGVAVDDDGRPAPRSRIAQAGAVGVDGDAGLGQGCQYRYRPQDSQASSAFWARSS
jgi:hypothetical protein